MHRILHLITKIDRETDGAPEWILLFAAGLGKLANGVEFFVDRAAFDLVAAMVAARGNEIHWDYEHASLEKNPAPAAGWIKDLAWEDGVGIKARVEWTEKAAAFIAAKEYRYFSPVFGIRKADKRVCYLHSVALTNNPKTNNLTPIVARLEAELDPAKEEHMDRAKLIAALGLKDDATDQEILAAIAKLEVAVPEATTTEIIPETVIAALDLKPEDNASTVVASIHALKQTAANGVSVTEFNALKKEIADGKAADAVAAAMKAGKVTPDQKDWALQYAKDDLAGFGTFVAKAPQVIPVTDLPGKKDEADAAALDAATLEVAKQMGVDPEDIKDVG